MELPSINIQVVVALISFAATIAAWQAANAARRSADTQEKSLAASIEDYRSRQRPRLATVFRVSDNDKLYLDVSNYGGLAVNIEFESPKLLTEHSIKNALNLLTQCVPLAHGIDALRPGETIPLLVGDRLGERLMDDWALEKLAEASGLERPLLRYRVNIRYTDVFGERLHTNPVALLDKTAWHRK